MSGDNPLIFQHGERGMPDERPDLQAKGGGSFGNGLEVLGMEVAGHPMGIGTMEHDEIGYDNRGQVASKRFSSTLTSSGSSQTSKYRLWPGMA